MAETKKTKSAASGSGPLQAPKGMHDVLPAEQPYWERIRTVTKELADFYNFSKIDLPVLESARLFERGVGAETDIVAKEMYTLKTRGGDVLALRPEASAQLIRAYLEHGLSRLGQPQKLYLVERMFRHENPQHGRYRQFTQVEFDIVGGVNDPIYDAQVIATALRLIEGLKIKGAQLLINSIGCRICRPTYIRQLQGYYRTRTDGLCGDCVRRLKTNPLRLLDCKKEDCQKIKADAPNLLNRLCAGCSGHLKSVLEYLDELQIPYELARDLVRGLDYYNRTVFEFEIREKGAEAGSVCGGGRYDYLAELLGGRPTLAVGWAMSFERLIDVMRAQEVTVSERPTKKVFVVHAGELAKKKALALVEQVRQLGVTASESLARESLKAQLKVADREKASLALIVGQKEVYDSTVIVRDLRSGLQETIPLSKLGEEVKKRLKAAE
ncbi:MAG: histidine--tRNA ligase [Candidatus Liptonbacteria bacterium]|nr:histidine--tRNA ligase [Candidatus Liptonbacteria bacterium]